MTAAQARDLTGHEFVGIDFSGMDLTHLKVQRSMFRNCNFDDADMSESDFEFCDFTGSTFRRTNCYMTSFKRSSLAGAVFAPRNAFGMTMTFECKTFQHVRISAQWWYFWLMLIASMNPDVPVLKDDLIGAIGAERYARLKRKLECQEL